MARPSDRDWEASNASSPRTASTWTCRSDQYAAALRGPRTSSRLKVGPILAGYVNHDGVLVSNGTDVMYESTEIRNWVTGETAVLHP